MGYRASQQTVPFALGVSPPIVIGAFKRRTPQANGTVTTVAIAVCFVDALQQGSSVGCQVVLYP